MRRPTTGHDVTLILDGFRIDGAIHVEGDRGRFQDVWSELLRGRRDFIPVSDAVVFRNDGLALSTESFLLVPKRDVRAAFPRTLQDAERPGLVSLTATQVSLVLRNLTLHGTVHVDPAKRTLSDAWGALLADRRTFLPVTQVRMVDHSARERGTIDLLLVDKDDINAVYTDRASDEVGVQPREVPTRATLLLDGVRVDGTLYLDRGQSNFERLSDRWDALLREHRPFVLVTDAKLRSIDSALDLDTAGVVFVYKTAIRAVLPAD